MCPTEDKTVSPSAFPRHLEQAATIDVLIAAVSVAPDAPGPDKGTGCLCLPPQPQPGLLLPAASRALFNVGLPHTGPFKRSEAPAGLCGTRTLNFRGSNERLQEESGLAGADSEKRPGWEPWCWEQREQVNRGGRGHW